MKKSYYILAAVAFVAFMAGRRNQRKNLQSGGYVFLRTAPTESTSDVLSNAEQGA